MTTHAQKSDRFAHGTTGYRGMAARWLDVTVDLAATRADIAP